MNLNVPNVETELYIKYIASLKRIHSSLLVCCIIQVIIGLVYLTFLSFKFEYTVFTIKTNAVLLLTIGIFTFIMYCLFYKFSHNIVIYYLFLIAMLHIFVIILMYTGSVGLADTKISHKSEISQKMIRDLIFHEEDSFKLGNLFLVYCLTINRSHIYFLFFFIIKMQPKK